MALAFFARAGQAAVIAVDGTTCILANAILSANSDAAVGGCSAGAGADTLVLGADVVLTTAVTADVEGGPSGLPAISSTISVEAGAGSTIERSNLLACDAASTPFRLLEVASGGDLTLAGLILRNGCLAALDVAATASGGAVLVRHGASMRLDNCHLENNKALGAVAAGNGSARGGAVAVLEGKLEIFGSTFVDNEVSGSDARGGALAIESGELPALARTRFLGNRATATAAVSVGTAASGGAVSLRRSAAGTLAHVEFRDNGAGPISQGMGGPAAGGGIELTGGSIRELRDSLFEANFAQASDTSATLQGHAGSGGGLASSGSIDTIERTTFSMNQALGNSDGTGRGGGLDNSGRIGRVVSTTFSGNSAEAPGPLHFGHQQSLGGGLANSGTIGQVTASTFVDNFVTSSFFGGASKGGGIYDAGTVSLGAGVASSSSLFAGNYASMGHECWTAGALVSIGFNLQQVVDDFSCAFAAPGDLTGLEPQLLPLNDNGCTTPLPNGSCVPTVALAGSSPALDAGLCSAAGTEIDARGAVRPQDLPGVPNAPGSDGCDIGAFELDGALATVHLGLSVAESVDPVGSGSGAGNLTYTVALASLGSQAANGVVVTPTLPIPTGVALDAVLPSTGSWDGTNWTIATLPSGGSAALTFVLTVGFGTASGQDVLGLSAAVTAATGHSGELAADAETTSVVEGVFFDGFESGDTSAWSLTVGGS